MREHAALSEPPSLVRAMSLPHLFSAMSNSDRTPPRMHTSRVHAHIPPTRQCTLSACKLRPSPGTNEDEAAIQFKLACSPHADRTEVDSAISKFDVDVDVAIPFSLRHSVQGSRSGLASTLLLDTALSRIVRPRAAAVLPPLPPSAIDSYLAARFTDTSIVCRRVAFSLSTLSALSYALCGGSNIRTPYRKYEHRHRYGHRDAAVFSYSDPPAASSRFDAVLTLLAHEPCICAGGPFPPSVSRLAAYVALAHASLFIRLFTQEGRTYHRKRTRSAYIDSCHQAASPNRREDAYALLSVSRNLPHPGSPHSTSPRLAPPHVASHHPHSARALPLRLRFAASNQPTSAARIRGSVQATSMSTFHPVDGGGGPSASAGCASALPSSLLPLSRLATTYLSPRSICVHP